MKIAKWAFNDFPRAATPDEYTQARDRLVERFAEHPSVSAIYEFGSIGDPGLSDLDMILVIRDGADFTQDDIDYIKALNNYVFVHPPFVIQESMICDINYLFYTSNIRLVSGKQFELNLPAQGKTELIWFICAEAALGRLCDLAYLGSISGNVSIRSLILKLSSIRHAISLVCDNWPSVRKTEWDDFSARIGDLRGFWFTFTSGQQTRMILELFMTSMNVLFGIIDFLSEIACEKLFLTENSMSGRDPMYLRPNSMQAIKFTDSAQACVKVMHNPFAFIRHAGFGYSGRISRHLNNITVINVPPMMMPLFKAGAESNGDGLRVNWNKYRFAFGNPAAEGIMDRRNMLYDKYEDFILKQGFSCFSPLTMGGWQVERKAMSYDLKRTVLKALAAADLL